MSTKLLFLSNPYFYQSTVDALERLQPDCETIVAAYENFDHIMQVYEQYAEECDAVFVAGTSARHLIAMNDPRSRKPLVAYQVDSDGLHRDILRLAIDTQNLDFSRIAVDFLIPMDCGYSVVDFLKLESLAPVIRENERVTEAIGSRSNVHVDRYILERIISLWESNSIDMVLCLYAAIVPALQERGIPYRCPFISDESLERLIHEVMARIELERLHENHPAIVQVFPRHLSGDGGEQIRQIHKCLEQFTRDHIIECILQESKSCCTVITSLKVLRDLTSEFRVCQISTYLEDRLTDPVVVGYGVGTTVSHAMNNVQIASKEAKILGHAFVVDSNGSLIGPLNSEKRMVIDYAALPNAGEIAKRCGLSAMTIQKLISIERSTGSNKITTQELARRLETTVRNANRIMLNLCKGGAARPVYTQTSHSRGRPIQVYALEFDTVV